MLRFHFSRLHLPVAAFLFVLATSAVAQQVIQGPTLRRTYIVNTASFQTLFPSLRGPSGFIPSLTRSISYASNHWAAYAGARTVFDYEGETNAVQCTGGAAFVVAAVAGCAPSFAGCGTLATGSTCWPAGGDILFYTGSGQGLSLRRQSPPLSPKNNDFHALLVHEIGHTILLGAGEAGGGHVNGTAEIMRNTLNETPGLGLKDLSIVGRSGFGLTAIGYPNSAIFRYVSNFTSPLAWSAPLSSAVRIGVGGVEMVSGRDVNSGSEWKLVMSSSFQAGSLPSNAANLQPFDAAWTATITPNCPMKPTVVFDPVRNVWWMFCREMSAANPERVRVFSGTPGLPSWTDRGLLTTNLFDIRTRYPIGAAFDPRSEGIVIVWNSSVGALPDTICNGSCAGEIIAARLQPSQSGTLVVSHVRRFSAFSDPNRAGYSGLGSPSVVCDPSGDSNYFNRQCEVYVVNWTEFREIVNWRFSVSSVSGIDSFSTQYSERSSSPGETDYPISVSGRLSNGAGATVVAVAGTDRRLWWRSKTSTYASYGSWLGPGPSLVASPSLKPSVLGTGYDLLISPEAP